MNIITSFILWNEYSGELLRRILLCYSLLLFINNYIF